MKLIILGSGGYGRVVSDIASQSALYDEILFLDDNATAPDVLGKCEEFQRFDGEFYPAFGNNEARVSWIRRLTGAGKKVATIVHPTAYVSPTATLGVGVTVLPNASVGSFTVVGDGCIINMGALIDHNCTIAQGCHICLGAIVKADNHLPETLKIEAGQVVENRTYQGKESV